MFSARKNEEDSDVHRECGDEDVHQHRELNQQQWLDIAAFGLFNIMFCLPWKVCVFEEVPVDHDCALDSASHWIGGWFKKKLW